MRILAGQRFDKEKVASADGRILLRCWEDYVFEGELAEAVVLPKACVKSNLPGDAGWRLLVNFGDYIGLLRLGGHTVEIRSKKLDSHGFDQLLRQITDRISNLPFDVNAPAFVPFSRDALNERDRIYHALVYLRWAMRFRSPALKESWGQVSADPHRTLVREERRAAPWDVRGVTPRTLERIASHPETWASVASGSPLMSTALAQSLVDPQGRHYFPHEVVEVVAETCLDTPENRFAKHFLAVARELLERADAVLSAVAGSDAGLVEEARALAEELRAMEATPFLRDVGQMQRFPAHSQVLQKRAEYRDLLLHYQALVLAASYPISADDLTRIIETKSASLLYEYWCFFEMAEQLSQLLGPPVTGLVASGDQLHATLGEGLKLEFAGGAELHYNRSFARSGSPWRTYSVPLRPDIVLKLGDALHLFDAKFRVDRWDIPGDESQQELEAIEADDRAGVASKGWWKNADIHKMHAYKDALRSGGAKAATVWVLYPGSEFVFYDEGGAKLSSPQDLEAGASGVGAIPAAPVGNSAGSQCGAVLASLMAQSAQSASSSVKR